MAVSWILTQGIGFSPGAVKYIPTRGFLQAGAAPPPAAFTRPPQMRSYRYKHHHVWWLMPTALWLLRSTL